MANINTGSFAKALEPDIDITAGIALVKYDGVVLIHREQAFAPAAGAQPGR